MKVAVIGSRSLSVPQLEKYLPEGTTVIISGGASGVDSSAGKYAEKAGLALELHLPDYAKWGRRAPIVRNVDIVNAADMILAFWDARSSGTRFVISRAQKLGKPIRIYLPGKAPEEYVLYTPPRQLKFTD